MVHVLEMTALRTNICLEPFAPLFNSRKDNFLVRIAPAAVSVHERYGCLPVYTLLHGRLCLTVNWTGVWRAVQRP